MYLNKLEASEGATKNAKRVGRGSGSGHGKTSCRGHKGTKARAGYNAAAGFEGGQMPLYRRLPKRGFNNAQFKTEYEVVNVSQLNIFSEGTVVTPQMLKERGLISADKAGVKILSDGDLTVKLTVEAHRFSKKAAEKIEQAQGTCKTIE